MEDIRNTILDKMMKNLGSLSASRAHIKTCKSSERENRRASSSDNKVKSKLKLSG